MLQKNMICFNTLLQLPLENAEAMVGIILLAHGEVKKLR